jgi:hypothetical protein
MQQADPLCVGVCKENRLRLLDQLDCMYGGVHKGIVVRHQHGNKLRGISYTYFNTTLAHCAHLLAGEDRPV